MQIPLRKPTAPPPRLKKLEDTIRFQPNPVFTDRAEMEDWVKNNVPDGKIVRVWEVTMLACEVETKSKAAAVTKRKKNDTANSAKTKEATGTSKDEVFAFR